MDITEINNGIYYAGINDRSSVLFESLWAIPKGITYNSYIVKGEKTALIDTVDASSSNRFLNKIKAVIGDANLDYLVINHMEPDHSGSIQFILDHFPGVKIVGNKITADQLSGFYNIKDNVMIVGDGDEIDLGGRTLTFKLTPMVHWPETMMTFDSLTGTLFTGDAFGTFGALNGEILDHEIEIEEYIPEAFRYYACIVAKYGKFVQRALAKLKGMTINMLCPTHGPVWRDYMMHILDLYDRLSQFKAVNGVVIAYGSMYGNTEEIAELLARIFTLKGIPVKMHNLTKSDLSDVLSDSIKYKGIIVGSPTYSNGILPPVETYLNALVTREFKDRVFASFGSFTWGPGIKKKLDKIVESLDFSHIENPFEMKQAQIESIENNIEEFVDRFISELNK